MRSLLSQAGVEPAPLRVRPAAQRRAAGFAAAALLLCAALACAADGGAIRDTGAAMASGEWVDLVAHPAAAPGAVRRLSARAAREGARLRLTYRLDGDLSRLRVPSPAAARVAHGLWEHTCFEAFIAAGDAPAYVEFNFSPSGEWAAYAFTAYRAPRGLASDGQTPHIAVRRDGDRLELEASVALDRLSPALSAAPLRVGLSAVIEADDGTRTYWALSHPPGAPDFHQAASRLLRVAGASGTEP